MGYLSQETISVISELPLEQAIGHYTPIEKNGACFKGSSPFNKEKTPSFFVHPAKGFWKDFSSGKGGRDVIGFLMQWRNVEFVEAVKQAANDFNIELKYEDDLENQQYKKELEERRNCASAMEWALSEFLKNDIPSKFLERFNESALAPFKIGYCTGVLDEARRSGIDLEHLHQVGLINKGNNGYYETFKGRIIFPLFDQYNTIIGFSGRKLNDEDKGPKYLHTKGLEKSKLLYGFQMASKFISAQNKCYLVEGPTDVIRFNEYQIQNTVAKLGSDLSEYQAKLIKKYCDTLVIIPDDDDAGHKSLESNASIAIAQGLVVKILFPNNKF